MSENIYHKDDFRVTPGMLMSELWPSVSQQEAKIIAARLNALGLEPDWLEEVMAYLDDPDGAVPVAPDVPNE